MDKIAAIKRVGYLRFMISNQSKQIAIWRKQHDDLLEQLALRGIGSAAVDAILADEPEDQTPAVEPETDDRWIKHDGGEMPFDEDCAEAVPVRFADGEQSALYEPSGYLWFSVAAYIPPAGWTRHSDGKWRAEPEATLFDPSIPIDAGADLRAQIDAAVAEHLTDEMKAEGWVFVGYSGEDVTGGDDWLMDNMASMLGNGEKWDTSIWCDFWCEKDINDRVIAVRPPEGYHLVGNRVVEIETETTPEAPEEAAQAAADARVDTSVSIGTAKGMWATLKAPQLTEPEGEGWIKWEPGPSPVAHLGRYEQGNIKVWFGYDSPNRFGISNAIGYVGQRWMHDEQFEITDFITHIKLPPGYELVDGLVQKVSG